MSEKIAARFTIGLIGIIIIVYIIQQIVIWLKIHFLIIAIVLGIIALLVTILLFFRHKQTKTNNQIRQSVYIANLNQELTRPDQNQNNTPVNMQHPSLTANVSQKLNTTAIYPANSPWKRNIPENIRAEVYKRAQNKCENEECNYSKTIHIHHIDMNKDNNDFRNLVALCPNCHSLAHNGQFSTTQLRNWVMRDYRKLYGKSVE